RTWQEKVASLSSRSSAWHPESRAQPAPTPLSWRMSGSVRAKVGECDGQRRTNADLERRLIDRETRRVVFRRLGGIDSGGRAADEEKQAGHLLRISREVLRRREIGNLVHLVRGLL